MTQLLPLLDRVPAVAGLPGRPRQRPDNVIADRGYDSNPHRRRLCQRGITPVIARRKTEHGSGWAATAGSSNVLSPGLNRVRRILVGWEKRVDTYLRCCTLPAG